jgi:DNA-binding beta-propeller fold protein YncE
MGPRRCWQFATSSHSTALKFIVALLAGLSLPSLALASPSAATDSVPLVYVSLKSANAVAVVDAATQSIVTEISTHSQPTGLALSPDKTRLYVCDWAGKVDVIDTATNEVTQTFGSMSEDSSIAVSPDGTRIYVLSYATSVVKVFSSSSFAELGEVRMPNVGSPGAVDLAISASGEKGFVVDQDDDAVIPFSTATLGIGKPIQLAAEPRQIAISGIYGDVTLNRPDDSVIAFDTETDYDYGSGSTNTQHPSDGVAESATETYTTYGGRLGSAYVYEGPTIDGWVRVVRGLRYPKWITVASDGSTAYVAEAGGVNAVVPINLETYAKEAAIELPSAPSDIVAA